MALAPQALEGPPSPEPAALVARAETAGRLSRRVRIQGPCLMICQKHRDRTPEWASESLILMEAPSQASSDGER